MTIQYMNRRQLILSVATMTALSPAGLKAQDLPRIHVVKGQGCECCEAWVEYLRQEGFTVTDEVSYGTLLIRHKMDLGIPANAFSCHTGKIADYVIEGHVPAADIRRLLAEKPDAIGLSVPGMPYGSPGMGPEDNRDAYDVLLIQRDGTLPLFTSYPAA